jgi:hypothetical protein
MDEYLAHIAATTGGLLAALRDADPDRELLSAAGEILEALVAGGPAEDLADYDEGADAVEAYLGHLTDRAETLGDYLAIASIRSFLVDEQDWEELGTRGWAATRRAAYEARCDEILGRDQWEGRIAVGLLSDEPAELWRAERAARLRGLDTFDLHLHRVRLDPLGSSWFNAWQQADTERARQLADLALDLLPLHDIATGPAQELGLGPGWEAHRALDWTLQALRDHPGVGADLLVVGLQSPVTRNRNLALNVLKAWPGARWPPAARELAERVAASDPDERTRAYAAEVLRASRR